MNTLRDWFRRHFSDPQASELIASVRTALGQVGQQAWPRTLEAQAS